MAEVLDHRFGWSSVRAYVPIAGNILLLLSFLFFTVIFQEKYLWGFHHPGEERQKVVSIGPYAFVRHLLYAELYLLLFIRRDF